jgi:6,7-dimethyl-8-ribityllumazine synthase
MADIKKNLDYGAKADPASRIGIAVSRYNSEITQTLLKSCVKTLVEQGMKEKQIQVVEVPGAFELPYACQKMALSKKFDALIALGAIVKGGTPHFDFVAQAATQGAVEVSLKYNIPVIFGVLTTNDQEQARDRIHGGKNGDKGIEAALTALRMVNLSKMKLDHD